MVAIIHPHIYGLVKRHQELWSQVALIHLFALCALIFLYTLWINMNIIELSRMIIIKPVKSNLKNEAIKTSQTFPLLDRLYISGIIAYIVSAKHDHLALYSKPH